MEKIKIENLDSKERERYNLQLLMGTLVQYGYYCQPITIDWNDADLIAVHFKTKQIMRIQLKSRLTVDKKYEKKDLYIAFPIPKKELSWVLIKHDKLIEKIANKTTYLKSKSWKEKGFYSTDNPNEIILNELKKNVITMSLVILAQPHSKKKML